MSLIQRDGMNGHVGLPRHTYRLQVTVNGVKLTADYHDGVIAKRDSDKINECGGYATLFLLETVETRFVVSSAVMAKELREAK